jgi:hypothetical protein
MHAIMCKCACVCVCVCVRARYDNRQYCYTKILFIVTTITYVGTANKQGHFWLFLIPLVARTTQHIYIIRNTQHKSVEFTEGEVIAYTNFMFFMNFNDSIYFN